MSEQTIIEQVGYYYNIKVTKIEKIDRGKANIYKIFSDDKIYILKQFQAKYSEKQLQKELHIINHLNKYNLNIPKYFQCLNQQYYFIYNNRLVALQEYISGITKEKNSGDLAQCLESARYLGLIVQALETYPYHDFYFCDLKKFLFKNNLKEQYSDLLQKALQDKINGPLIIKDLNEKLNIFEEILHKYDFENIEKVTVKKTHGDYSVMQFIYEHNEIKAILDFEGAAALPVVWEIIRSYSYIDEKCQNGVLDLQNLILYIKEYMKYSPLNKYDLQYMPYIYLLQLLNSPFGYKEYLYSGDLKLLEFGQKRTELCRYLANNSEMISQKLLEIID